MRGELGIVTINKLYTGDIYKIKNPEVKGKLFKQILYPISESQEKELPKLTWNHIMIRTEDFEYGELINDVVIDYLDYNNVQYEVDLEIINIVWDSIDDSYLIKAK